MIFKVYNYTKRTNMGKVNPKFRMCAVVKCISAFLWLGITNVLVKVKQAGFPVSQ